MSRAKEPQVPSPSPLGTLASLSSFAHFPSFPSYVPAKHNGPFAVSQGHSPMPPHSIVVVVVEKVDVVVDVVVVDVVVDVVVVVVDVVVEEVVVLVVVDVLVEDVVVGFKSATGEYMKK